MGSRGHMPEEIHHEKVRNRERTEPTMESYQASSDTGTFISYFNIHRVLDNIHEQRSVSNLGLMVEEFGLIIIQIALGPLNIDKHGIYALDILKSNFGSPPFLRNKLCSGDELNCVTK